MNIGVLALQGDFVEHIGILRSLDVDCREVRTVEDLENIDGLIIPGGESTTMQKLLASTGIDQAMKNSSIPMLGTCAGAIILANLRLLDISIERNAYGRQLDSFRTDVQVQGKAIPAAFIRAPKITRVGEGVHVEVEHEGDPVFVRQDNVFVTTFHTEVTGHSLVHEMFLSSISSPEAA